MGDSPQAGQLLQTEDRRMGSYSVTKTENSPLLEEKSGAWQHPLFLHHMVWDPPESRRSHQTPKDQLAPPRSITGDDAVHN